MPPAKKATKKRAAKKAPAKGARPRRRLRRSARQPSGRRPRSKATEEEGARKKAAKKAPAKKRRKAAKKKAASRRRSAARPPRRRLRRRLRPRSAAARPRRRPRRREASSSTTRKRTAKKRYAFGDTSRRARVDPGPSSRPGSVDARGRRCGRTLRPARSPAWSPAARASSWSLARERARCSVVGVVVDAHRRAPLAAVREQRVDLAVDVAVDVLDVVDPPASKHSSVVGRCGASPCSGKKCGSRAATMPSIASSPACAMVGMHAVGLPRIVAEHDVGPDARGSPRTPRPAPRRSSTSSPST